MTQALGPAFQRPDKRVLGQGPEAVRVRYEETRPTIRARAKEEGGEVLFADHENDIELNLDELVNTDLNRSMPHTCRARNRAEFAAESRRFFPRRQRRPRVVCGYCGSPHVRCILGG